MIIQLHTDYFITWYYIIFFYLQAEVERRDKEIEKLNALLSDTKRKNQKVQDKMIEQIEIIKNKLEEYKLDHKTHESSIEDDIGAKYLGFFSSRSLKMREKCISFAQLVYFLREVCLLFNFWMIKFTIMFFWQNCEFYHSKIEKYTNFPQNIYKLSKTNL